MLTTLLITNIIITLTVATMVLKEIDRLKRDIEHTELSVTVQTRKDAEKLGYDIAGMEKELKEQISKEFMGLSFRGIKIK